MTDLGKARRLSRVFDHRTKRTVIVPLDDVLLSGPEGGLRDTTKKVREVVAGGANAIIGFQGLFERNAEELLGIGGILNLTASTIRSRHTRKVLVSSVEEAVKLGMDCAAVHVNISSEYESEMLKNLGEVSRECERMGMPLMGIMYPRTERDGVDYNYWDLLESDPEKYTELVRHAARVGVDLGADMIKTHFTGRADLFHTVIESCSGVPIVVSGGPKVPLYEMLNKAYQAIKAGASGISFGRNIFHRDDSSKYIKLLDKIVHDGYDVEEALKLFSEFSLE